MKSEDDKKIDLTTGIADLEVADKIRDIQQSFETGQVSRRSFMTGALAMGISQRRAAVPTLVRLLRDTHAARKLCKRNSVDPRTRAFAGYSLGLIAAAQPSVALKRMVLESLRDVLLDRSRQASVLRNPSIRAPGPPAEYWGAGGFFTTIVQSLGKRCR